MGTSAAALIAAVALFAAGCGDDGADRATPSTTISASGVATTTTSPTTVTTVTSPPVVTTTQAPTGPPFDVESTATSFVDASRILPAGAQTEQEPVREIDVWIDAPLTDEPRPLVILAHGLTGHPRSHQMMRTHLAAEGFVVVAPAFPLTNTDVAGGFANAGDTEQQVRDVTFLIDTVLADPDLGPRIDQARIGMVGHSLGGLTTAGAALAPTGDERISAAVVMSAGFGQARPDVAVMVVHGDRDLVVPYESSETSYSILTGRRMFVTLVGGDHSAGILDDSTDLGDALRGLSTAFLAHELEEDGDAVFAFDDLPLDSVRIQAATDTGPLDDWRDYFSD